MPSEATTAVGAGLSVRSQVFISEQWRKTMISDGIARLEARHLFSSTWPNILAWTKQAPRTPTKHTLNTPLGRSRPVRLALGYQPNKPSVGGVRHPIMSKVGLLSLS